MNNKLYTKIDEYYNDYVVKVQTNVSKGEYNIDEITKEFNKKIKTMLNVLIQNKIVKSNTKVEGILREYIKEKNRRKRIQLMNDIGKCQGDYSLFCIDIDDVIYDTDRVMQDKLTSIDYRATKKYRELISKETSEDSLNEIKKSFSILDSILEEYPYIEELEDGTKRKYAYPKIDYSDIYRTENLISGSIDNVNKMIEQKDEKTFFIYLSHCNPEREGLEKMLQLYKLTPQIDAIITLPYHIGNGSKEVNSKGTWVKQSLALDNLDKCILIDNSKSNCKEWRRQGGIDIRYLTDGFELPYILEEHLLRLPSLDPTNIQFIISCIKHVRDEKNKDYLNTISEHAKTLTKI